MNLFATTLYAVTVVSIVTLYFLWRRAQETKHKARIEKAQVHGDIEPASLHPIIDPAKCMGCGACVKACPEGDILGIAHGKARLVAAANCIGHGACQRACPYSAIELVFGTEKRGVDIPKVKSNFETNVPGLFISGELGGMGLVANAVEQGCQAVQSVVKHIRKSPNDSSGVLDLLIIGAGPSGIAASLTAKKHELNFVTLEQDSLGGTVTHFPRRKLVMTRPVKLPLFGTVKIHRIEKEKLISLWQEVISQTGINPRFGHRVSAIEKRDNHFSVETDASETFCARCVLLAIGRRGTPRKLEVPGEENEKVFYRLLDPDQYAGSNILVVGGGDSALEAAMTLAAQPGARVTLSYRGTSVFRAKPENREKFTRLVDDGVISAIWESKVLEIKDRSVVIHRPEGATEIKNDWVLVSAGGVLPTALLQQAGVEIQTCHGTSPVN